MQKGTELQSGLALKVSRAEFRIVRLRVIQNVGYIKPAKCQPGRNTVQTVFLRGFFSPLFETRYHEESGGFGFAARFLSAEVSREHSSGWWDP
jgi:hypothetical protein